MPIPTPEPNAVDRLLAAEAAGAWRCIQTHLSCVAIAGELVYKVKKPIDLGFVDFTAAETRRRACLDEVRLNRRLAPEIYLGVAPLLADAGPAGVRFGPVRDEAVAAAGETPLDWATAMRRLPDDGLLDRVLARWRAAGNDGSALREPLRRFASRLARFHAGLPSPPEVARWGAPVAVLRRIKHTLAGLARHGSELLAATAGPGDPDPWTLIARLVGGRVQAAMPILGERHARGLVREVHGDLHCRNLCLLADEIVPFDCIEFSEELRCRDVAADAVRVDMDLAARGFPSLGRAFLDDYRAAAGDPDAARVFPVFAARDAVVHAFIESVAAGEAEVPPDERREAAAAARTYALLAVGYALPRPALVVLAGLPGTGKSVAARAVAAPLRATLLASDAIRKELAGLAPTARADAALYAPEWNERTYAELARRAEAALAAGEHVVIDANNRRRSERDRFRALASRRGAIGLLVEMACPEEEILRRLAARGADPHEVSDAGPATFAALRSGYEPPDPATEGPVLRLTPERDAAASIAWRLAELALPARPEAMPSPSG